jgi:ribosomal protein S18 acetylase RimI-like enzyme
MHIQYLKIVKDDAKQIAIFHKKVFNDILSYQDVKSLEKYYIKLIENCFISQKAIYENRIVGYLIFSNENPFGTLIKASYFKFIYKSLKYFLSNKKEILFLVLTFLYSKKYKHFTELSYIAVDGGLQRSDLKIGTNLINNLYKKMKSEEIWLKTNNTNAIDFYKKNGFTLEKYIYGRWYFILS